MQPSDLIEPDSLRPLRRSEYDQLVVSGAFDDEKLELLFGCLVRKNSEGTHHAVVITRLTRSLILAVDDDLDVRCQLPLAASDVSEPEPDFAVVPHADYLPDHPTAALLVIEVAVSSVTKDRVVKSRLYAEMGVPEYWLVNLSEGVVEVFREPAGSGYAQRTTVTRGDTLRSSVVPAVEVAADAILP